MKRKFSYLFLLVSIGSWSQNETKFHPTLEGQLTVASDAKGVYVNFGGPGIKGKLKSIDISINMMPSLRLQEEQNKPFITPILGFGPQLYFAKNKRWILAFPTYYYANTQTWVFTGGIGYQLTTKK